MGAEDTSRAARSACFFSSCDSPPPLASFLRVIRSLLFYTKSELAYPCGNRCEHRTLPVTVWPWPGQGERLRRGRGRARAPAGRRSRPGRSLSNASMPVSHRPPAARVAVAAPPRRRDYVSSPRRLASARRLTGVVATEATTPRRRVRHAAHRREGHLADGQGLRPDT